MTYPISNVLAISPNGMQLLRRDGQKIWVESVVSPTNTINLKWPDKFNSSPPSLSPDPKKNDGTPSGLKDEDSPSMTAFFSPHGDWLALTVTGGVTATLIWDKNSETLAHLQDAPPEIAALAFSPNGDNLAILPKEGQEIGLWDVKSKQKMVTQTFSIPSELSQTEDRISQIAFLDDNRLAAFQKDGQIIIWGLSDREPMILNLNQPTIPNQPFMLGQSPSQPIQITAMAVNPDSKMLPAVGLDDGSVRLFTMNAKTNDAVTRACQYAGRNLTQIEFIDNKGGEIEKIGDSQICPKLPPDLSVLVEMVRENNVEKVEKRLQPVITQTGISSTTILAGIYLESGRRYVAEGKYDEALKDLKQASTRFNGSQTHELATVYKDICGNNEFTNREEACTQAAALANQTQDALLNLDVCRNGQTISKTVEPACEKTVELAQNTPQASLSFTICQRSFEGGLSDWFEQICQHTLELAEKEDAVFNMQLCQISTEKFASACKQAAKLAQPIEPGQPERGEGNHLWKFSGEKVGPFVRIALLQPDVNAPSLPAPLPLPPPPPSVPLPSPLPIAPVPVPLGLSSLRLFPGITLLNSAGKVLDVLGANQNLYPLPQQGKNNAYFISILDVSGVYTLSLDQPPIQAITFGLPPLTGQLETSTILTFTGRAGQIVRMGMAEDGSGIDSFLTLVGPDGQILAMNDNGDGSNALIHAAVLPKTGLYSLVPGSYQNSSGAYQLSFTTGITKPVDLPGLASGDLAEAVGWVFTGTAKQPVRISITSEDNEISPYLTLIGPDGTIIGQLYNYSGFQGLLPVAGKYTLTPGGSKKEGVYTIELTEAVTQPIEFGQPTLGEVVAGLGAIWTFKGQAGQIVTITMDADNSNIDSYLTLQGPDGQVIASDDDSGGANNSKIERQSLPTDGTYFIITRDYRSSFGGYSLRVTKD